VEQINFGYPQYKIREGIDKYIWVGFKQVRKFGMMELANCRKERNLILKELANVNKT